MFDFVAPERTPEFAAFKDANVDHPYLLAQPVGVYGLKQVGERLLAPICDPFSGQVFGWEEIWTLNDGETWKKQTKGELPRRVMAS